MKVLDDKGESIESFPVLVTCLSPVMFKAKGSVVVPRCGALLCVTCIMLNFAKEQFCSSPLLPADVLSPLGSGPGPVGVLL